MAGPATGEQSAFAAVEPATDDADVAAVELGRDFVEAEVFHFLALADGLDEALHLGIAHFHGVVLDAAFHKAVLQRGDFCHDGIETEPVLVHKQEVGHVGNFEDDFLAATGIDALHHGDEEFAGEAVAFVLQLPVGRVLGIGALEIAQHIPIGFNGSLFGFHTGCTEAFFSVKAYS